MPKTIKILGTSIEPGKDYTLNFNVAKLYTASSIEVPIIISRAKEDGPTVLLTGGIHGDEINGVEVVRQMIAKGYNKPSRGTIICLPILNIYGFLNQSRNFPDGRDLNRVFPGTKGGSLASRFASQFTTEILPHADVCLDFHTGGAYRFNAPHVRISPTDRKSLAFAKAFKAPFTMFSRTIAKTYRDTCEKRGIPYVLFEGGKSQLTDKHVIKNAVDGALRVLKHLNMVNSSVDVPESTALHKCDKHPEGGVVINKSRWIRASYSGLLHPKAPCGKHVEKGEFIATITDPYGTFRHKVLAKNAGYLINVNESPLVYQGDAIFHISVDE